MGGYKTRSSTPRVVQAVVFDFDGTIADTRIDFAAMRRRVLDLLRSLGAWCEGLEEMHYVLEIVNEGARWAQKQGRDPDVIRAEADAAIRSFETEAARRAPLLDDAAGALARLKDTGLKTGIITRNCAEAVHLVLARYPLRTDVLLTREHVPRVKPDPDHLLRALAALEISPDRAAFVGDHVTDVQCARGAGVLAVAVAGSSSSPEDLRRAGADFVASSLSQVADYVLGLSA